MRAGTQAHQPQADALAKRLLEAIEVPIPHTVGSLHVSATVGIRLVSDLEEIGAAVRQADSSMSAAKEAKAAVGRGARERR